MSKDSLTSNLVAVLRKSATALDTAEMLPEAFLPQRLRQAADEIERLTAERYRLTDSYVRETHWARGEIEQLQSILKVKDETIFALQADVVRYGDENRRLREVLEAIRGGYDGCVGGVCTYCLADAALKSSAHETAAPPAADWRCRKCGFTNSAARSTCWNCGK